ncbi:hypothetical protein [uncultured Paludibaculum sp.]|uniref:hypothetical protein n=1 Tax=uncultured Paludibaculum sp. TaxID=1765020 RepID=UPI002AAA7CF9|nr:hypothetical protein [uncultured Paludibaculum sp.]
MLENFRRFEVTDPFGRVWQVEFRWQQNAISIRHCDAVDCKYYITDGEEKREVVVALMHPDLLAASASRKRPLTDAWCMRLAGLHLQHMISTWEDMESSIVTVPSAALEAHGRAIEEAENQERERLLLAH